MTVQERLHRSKTHRDGFDPSCPSCIRDEGLNGIIEHLSRCAKQNDADGAVAVAAEQRRVIAVLKLYRMTGGAR
jgi:hypothetical protein